MFDFLLSRATQNTHMCKETPQGTRIRSINISEHVHMHAHLAPHTQVVKRGYMRKEDGMMMKKWITVYVELREECVCCFNNETERVRSQMRMGADVQARITMCVCAFL
jgi:hypothetical protein